MELIPAIDIMDGKVVRLHQGRYDRVTVYSDNPKAQAQQFYQAGARRLHVVDLDAARTGQPTNFSIVEGILSAVPLAVQIGGGIRDMEAAQYWFDAGADRVVVGTAAIKNPKFVQEICKRWPSHVVVAIDARDGQVAIQGWVEQSNRSALDLAREVDGWGATAILYTDIDRDGTRAGVNIEATLDLQNHVGCTVIASGGIGTLEDLKDLQKAGVRAAVCGRAFYAGAFTAIEAFEAVV